MIWLNPIALVALAAVAAPILIHILVQRRAERFAFPTLRFIAPTRLAAIRRHLLEDAALLAVRVAMLAAAAAALAGPLLLTAGRRQAWDQRVVRATVVAALAEGHVTAARAAFLDKTFSAETLTDGIRRAVAWLDAAPPARRELVVVSPFAIGSLTAADVAGVPANIGVRLERSGTLPPSRTVEGATLLAGTATAGVRALDRRVTLDGPQTIVGEPAAARGAPWPIDVRAPDADRAAVDAAVQAVLSQRVWMPPASHRAQLVLVPGQGAGTLEIPVQTVQPWMAMAIARMAADADLQAVALRVPAGLADARYAAAPWYAVASAADGRPLAAAAGTASQLIVVSAASAADLATPLLMRSIVNGMATPADLRSAEVVPIPDPVLRQWSRPVPASGTPRIENVDQDDRRWLWLAALGLLAIETWMRRARTAASRDAIQETSRVA